MPALPPELADLERALLARPRAHPPAELRGRVLAAVAAAATPVRRQPSSLWAYAATLALAALIGLNLARAAAAATSFDVFAPADTSLTPLPAAAQQVQDLAADLSPADSARCALLYRAAERLPRTPDLHGLPPSAALAAGEARATDEPR